MAVTVILLIAACLSAVSPITPVSSESQNREPASSLHETIDVCASSPTIGADTTWSAGNIYAINNCVVVVSSGATLTLEPGVVVQFGGPSTGLIIEGNLSAVGISSAPVVFTSSNDNSDSGGSNTANPGDWWGIVLREGSNTAFDYAHIRYAGSDTCVGAFSDTNYNSCYNRAQLDARKANLSMDHSVITSGETTGLFLAGDGLAPVVQNTLFENNSSDDTTAFNLGAAIQQTTINMQPTYANLTFSGNKRNQVVIPVGVLNQDVTLGGAPTGFTCGSNYCPITVASLYTLTIQSGADLDMTTGYLVFFLVQSGGTLSAIGSESDPISILESQFRFEAGSNGQLSHCEIDGNNFGSSVHGLIINTEGVSIENSTIKNYSGRGVYVSAPASTSISANILDTNIINNLEEGIYLDTTIGGLVNFSMDGGTISGNGRSGLKVVTSNGVINPTLKNLLIDANGTNPTLDSYKQGLHVDTSNASLILENLTITNHPGKAIYWRCDGSISAKNITASGNALGDELQIPGCAVTAGREWDLADAGIPVHVTNWITVEAGGLLSIAPGATLGFDALQQFYVKPGGSLYALGTADEPIILTRYSDAQTPWKGVWNSGGTMILLNTEIDYAGTASTQAVLIEGANSATVIQNSKIRYGAARGMYIKVQQPLIRNTVIADNTNEGIFRGSGTDPVDARFNWWGDASGPYHPTLNPTGSGNAVSDYVLFDPWLTEPPTEETIAGEMMVSTAGPASISPGEVNDYAIQYLNLQPETIYDAIAVIQLPLAGKYISSTEGGVYWPARHQVFWVLGDITPGSQGMLTARVRFEWGLASSYTDGSYTMLVGSNYQSEAINFAEYLNFDKDDLEDIITIETSTIPASPSFTELYNQAIAEGFESREAYKNFFEGGKVSYMLTMRTPDKRTARFISMDENGYASASTTDGSTFFSIEDLTGGQSLNLLTMEITLWGSWEDPAALNNIMAECNYARCMRNCTMKKVAIETMKNAAKRSVEWLLWSPLFGPVVAAGLAVYEVADMANETYICHQSCSTNPLTGCCVANEVLWSPSYWMGNSHCNKFICDPSSLSFPTFANSQTPCTYGYRCVAGSNSQGGCKPCIEEYKFLLDPMGPAIIEEEICSENSINGTKTKCSDLTIRFAKDPNAIYGPLGDVLPEQEMDYRITCENEGEGDAYGVYILNDLPEELDEDTLMINDGGIYLSTERQIIWYIGELAPKGEEGSEAEVTYTAQLKPGLPIGTAVVNQATVFFPSVPEETPTNTWINLVYPLAATPMLELETGYMTPLAITLAGRPAGSLTFNLENLPISGTLDGDLPNLIYTPAENFSGTDFFTFSVSLDDETSQSAQVTINVLASGDITGPSVLWVMPQDQETGVEFSETPIRTIPEGDVYAPVIVAKLSEKVQEETINSDSVSVLEFGGSVVPSKATFDPATNLLTIQLLSPLAGMRSYMVTLTTQITDLNGNPLSQDYSWQFFTLTPNSVFLPIMIK
jgi:hypothetical protein